MSDGFTLEGMTMVMTITVPDETARRIEAAAAARGETVEELALEAIDSSPLLTAPADPVVPVRRRKLAFVGIGASQGGTSHRIDELLADGFGRD